jgi:cation transport ATPase
VTRPSSDVGIVVRAFGYKAHRRRPRRRRFLTPVLASAAMLASSLAVVGNARRLRISR